MCVMLYRCGTSAYKSSSTDWKRKAATDAHTLNEYAELFGPGEAAGTEAAEAAATQNGQSHASPELASDSAADAVLSSVMMTDHQNKEGSDHGPANTYVEESGNIEPASGQPAATKKKNKKKSKKEDRGIAVKSQAPVKKQKGKKAKGGSEKQEGGAVSVLGLDSADAPWANEAVPDVIAAQSVTQGGPVKTKVRTQGQNQKTVGDALSTDQALALLGYAAAKPSSQQKKHKH